MSGQMKGLGKRGGVEGHVRAPQRVAQQALARGAAHHGHALVAHRVEPGQAQYSCMGRLGVDPLHVPAPRDLARAHDALRGVAGALAAVAWGVDGTGELVVGAALDAAPTGRSFG
jgi:hypothetical protein